ncbi:MAG: hypothetical protein LBH90_09095, partial [Tannerella sp.]|nr:hypothetical protein [Tannerella sp.]
MYSLCTLRAGISADCATRDLTHRLGFGYQELALSMLCLMVVCKSFKVQLSFSFPLLTGFTW